MAHPSDPGFRVLHGLRIKGFVSLPVLASVIEMPPSDVADHLAEHRDRGLVQYREGRITGWSLTAQGRERHAEHCAAELAAARARSAVADAYDGFLELNQPFLAVCTDWQVFQSSDDRQIVNDHADRAYDAAVIDRLAALHDAVTPLAMEMASTLERFGPYHGRFAAALARVRSGEHEWFTGPLVESYHTVWFELHEDLLATLGIQRDREMAR